MLKEFADDSSKFDENCRKYLKRVENTVGKGEIVFRRLVVQTCKNQGLFGKGLSYINFCRLQMLSIRTSLKICCLVEL